VNESPSERPILHPGYGLPACHCRHSLWLTRHSGSPRFSGVFPIIVPGMMIPDTYFQYREPVATDTIGNIEVSQDHHHNNYAFRCEQVEASRTGRALSQGHWGLG
jgi:hypothetical protein